MVYSLTQALRQRRVGHYVLRACPDGEGDWANEADRVLVREIRLKGDFTEPFIERAVDYLKERHLPLLVDVGGRPKAWQEAVFGACTHAVLLTGRDPAEPDSYQHALTLWREMMARHGVEVLAELTSELHGRNHLQQTRPLVTGTLAQLERGAHAAGPAFEALVERLTNLCDIDEERLTALHREQTPAGAQFIDLAACLDAFGHTGRRWEPEQLQLLREHISSGRELAVYGRAPNWVYAFLALHAAPAAVHLFDARLGWTRPPQIPLTDHPNEVQSGWDARYDTGEDRQILHLRTHSQYLDIERPDLLPIPSLPDGVDSLIITGKIPH